MASAQAGAKPGGKGGMIVTMVALTILAAIGGGLVGKLVVAGQRAPSATPATVAARPSTYGGDLEVKELSPIVTNLADPDHPRVRMQVSIVYSKKSVEKPTILTARIGDDFIAFLKTLTLTQLQGASGLQNLREDLNERAAIRSDGAVREVIIEALVMQ